MVTRIVRREGDRRAKVRTPNPGDPGSLFVKDQLATVEKRSFDQGYQEGERTGRRQGETLVDSAARRYDQQAAELLAAYQTLAESIERTMLELAMEMARRIVKRELETRPEILEDLVRENLLRVQFQPEITLRVSRADYPRILEKVTADNPAISVREDASLEIGDFLIDTALTHLDGRVASQVETLGTLSQRKTIRSTPQASSWSGGVPAASRK